MTRITQKPPAQVIPLPTKPTPTPAPTPKPAAPTPGVFVEGVDCAHYQAGIRFSEVYASGRRFTVNKASDGMTGVDAYSAPFRRLAKESALLVGHYHFFRFKSDPMRQARHFLDVVQLLAPGELCLALDVEWDNSSGGFERYRNGGEMDDFAADAAYACLLEIEKLSGATPWIYTAPGFWTEKFKNPERFSRFPLWLNDFKAKKVEELRVPKKTWSHATVWQYGEKAMAGVAGVDLNRFLGSEEELKGLVRK